MTERAGEWYSLAFLLVLVMCAAGIVLYRIDSRAFLYFGDAVSRLVKSREFIDSQHPGLGNIGTVWLPLPQLLLIPFALINGLFYSGIAGAMAGIPYLVGTGLLLFAIIRRITRSRPIAFLGACLFVLNPNVVYMALTPMSEVSLFFFITLGGYALLRWLETDAVKWLLLCAVAVMLATLCRYEAWVLAPFVVLVSASKGIGFWKESKRLSAIRIASFTAISFAGIAFWLIWNAAKYGNALEFLHWSASISPSFSRDSLQHRPLANLVTFGRRVRSISVRLFVIAGLLAMSLIQLTVPEVGVATFNDVAKSVLDMTRYSTALGERLHEVDDENSIALLTGYGQADRIMISSGLPLKRFHIICYPDKRDSLEPLSASDRYVVVESDLSPKSRELVDNWVSRGRLRNYEMSRQEGPYIFLEQRESFALRKRNEFAQKPVPDIANIR